MSRERARLAAMAAVILALNGTGSGVFVLTVVPHGFRFGSLGTGLGVAVTAWTLGARHAFDADHISAIDNVTRKLMSAGKRPLTTGFWFSLGHAAVVIAIGGGIAFAARAVFGAVAGPASPYHAAGGIAGTAVAACFLYLIAALNLPVLAGIARVLRDLRHGRYHEDELERQLQARGLMYRFFSGFMRSVSHGWQMFFVGLAFGAGFDTATEVALLSASVYAATAGLPWYAVLALPLIFGGGLTLCDTLDGCLMTAAYGWAFTRPARKAYYNLVITGLSVAAAFLIGTVELLGLLTSEFRLHGGLWDMVAGFSISTAGFAIAGLFVVVWLIAMAVWRFGNMEARLLPAGRPLPPGRPLPGLPPGPAPRPRRGVAGGCSDSADG